MELSELILSNEKIEPETLLKLYPELSDVDREYVMALKVIKTTNAVFEDFNVFENAVSILNRVSPNIELMEGTLPEWIWKAGLIIHRLRPDADYSDEVKEYIKYTYNDNGYKFYPPYFDLDNPILTDVTKKALEGPFPLREDFLGIQAARYLKIQRYLQENN